MMEHLVGKQTLAAILGCGVLGIGAPASGFDIVTRWTATQTDGRGLDRGDAITLLWSIVPDGQAYERAANSDLIGFLDDGWGVSPRDRDSTLTDRPWFVPMMEAYNQYSYVSGLTMQYVAEQDANGQSTNQRGDIRIGGEAFDTNPDINVLADNAFPNAGDMRIDTSPDPFFSSSNNAGFRNLISHESGHGVGLGHTIPTGAESVMEPGIQSHFFGLQFDDVYAFNRLYGDPGEKNGGNDSAATATWLGDFSSSSSTATFGADASDTVVEQFDDDWLGIDGSTDVDWFRFTVSQPSVVNLSVAPIGPTYTTEENGLFVSSEQSDLVVNLYSSGLSVIATSDQGGLGWVEQTNTGLLAPGEYFAQVEGKQDNNQFYRIDLSVGAPDPILTIDRDTGEATLRSNRDGGVDIIGYSISSVGGSLLPSDGEWLSLDDQGEPGWNETAFSQNELAEAGSTRSFGVSDEDFSLGSLYDPVVTEPFGTPHVEDIDFVYVESGSGGATSTGGVEYVGDPFANNLVLTVDPNTGLATIENESRTTIELIDYQVDSATGSLNPDGWISFEDQGLEGWTESDQTIARVGEQQSFDGLTLAPEDQLFLGELFDITGSQDLDLGFLLEGDPTDWQGVVRYGFVAMPGDYDADGDIDLADYDVWLQSFGSTESLLADGNRNSVIDAADYTVWRDAWTRYTPTEARTVPEPASAVVSSCLVVLAHRRRSSPTDAAPHRCTRRRRTRDHTAPRYAS